MIKGGKGGSNTKTGLIFEERVDLITLFKEIDGYKHIGYMSLGRLEEAQHNDDKAIAIYNNFILSAGDDPSFAQSRTEITSRIAMLKAKQ